KLIKYVQSKRRANAKDLVAVADGGNAGTVETRGLLAEDKVHALCQKEEPAFEAKTKLKDDVIVSGGTDAVVKEAEFEQSSDDTGRSKEDMCSTTHIMYTIGTRLICVVFQENYMVVSGGTDAVVKLEKTAE
ncbi:unnamed protein product, partial [Cylicostephanus goldi]